MGSLDMTVQTAETVQVSQIEVQKFSLFALTIKVVGSMVGAGVFSLPRAFATAIGVFGAIIAWLITTGGMYTLARLFQALAEHKPDLDAEFIPLPRPGSAIISGSSPPSGIFPAPASAIPFTGSVNYCGVGIHGLVTLTSPFNREIIDG